MRRLFLVLFILAFFSCKSSDANALGTTESQTDVQEVETSKVNENLSKEQPINQSEQDTSYQVLFSGSYGRGMTSAVIREDSFLKRIYESVYRDSTKMPSLDFEKQAVVVAYAGTFNTGGYGIVVDHIERTKNAVEVVFRVTTPNPKEAVTMAFTYPFIVIAVDAEPEMEVKFRIIGGKSNGYGDLDKFVK